MNASDLVTAALEKRPSDFFKIFNELALERAEALVGEMKDDIARGLVTSSESTDEEFDEEIESFLEYLSTLTEEEVDHEIEQLDEISRKTLRSYMTKAGFDSRNHKLAAQKNDSNSDKAKKLAARRDKGIKRAYYKTMGVARVHPTVEETETLNLGGYQPVPGAEKNFVSKHKVEKFGDRAGNGDAVYKGTTKPAKYPKADKGGTVASTE